MASSSKEGGRGEPFRRNSQDLFETVKVKEEEEAEKAEESSLSRSVSSSSIDSTENIKMLDLVASATKPEVKRLPSVAEARSPLSSVVESPKVVASSVRAPPAGIDRLPSAMRPPVRRGHCRSVSQGGASFYRAFVAKKDATGTPDDEFQSSALGSSDQRKEGKPSTSQPGPSVLKKSSTFAHSHQHRRVFSHGQIKFNTDDSNCAKHEAQEESETMNGRAEAVATAPKGGHRRQGSKTEFILPPGHEERKRKRNLLRSGSGVGTASSSNAAAAVTVSEVGGGGNELAGHRKLPSRTDSLHLSFRSGHSRQPSRTDSIYTLRPVNHSKSATNSVKEKLFFWNKFRSRRKFGSGGGEGDLNDAADNGHSVGAASSREKYGVDCHASSSSRSYRTVVPNHAIPADVPKDKHPNGGYANNCVSTTKYTVFTFLPKNLFQQFHRFANLYFLFIVLLNWVPAISAFGKEIAMLPVIFVLGVTAVKDLFEDRRRYLSDKRVNNSTCRIYKRSLGRYTKCDWKDVQVGDFVHLSCNEMIPADILVLRSSDDHGLCYIDTQNLDGEANLKQREVPRGFVEMQATFLPQDFRSSLECDPPTTKIYRFHGSILHSCGERVPVGKDNLLLRECVLKNTDFVEGIVVYAGHESKAMLNNGGPRYKRSKLERQMNVAVIWCVVILLVLCFAGAVGSGVWLNQFDGGRLPPFLNKNQSEAVDAVYEGFLTFWTFVIILQVIIPLSLYVTIECTKLLQVYLIHQDVQMYDRVLGESVECRAFNIPEELGQVQYIFCDKTGTLTENDMVFKRCTVGGCDYDHQSFPTKQQLPNNSHLPAAISANPALAKRLNSMDVQLLLEGNGTTETKIDPQCRLVQDFFLLLAVCNTVIVANHPHHDQMNASGVICTSAPKQTSFQNGLQPVDAVKDHDDSDDNAVSTTPHISLASTGTATSSLSSTTAPLQPEPTLTSGRSSAASEELQEAKSRRRSRLFDFFPGGASKPPLSPIASSPEASPPNSPEPARSKHLQLPGIFSKLMSTTSLQKNNLSKSSLASAAAESLPIYEAESPDELALVDAAYAYNCKLLKRTPLSALVSLPGEGQLEFEVLHVLPFDSVRKRMSIILRHPVSKERILYCKGADSAIFSRLKSSLPSVDAADVEKTEQQVNAYAKEGLRVLCMAKKVLDDEEYDEWLTHHNVAENALHHRDRLLFESYNRMEWDLSLLGSTGIEDKLQEGVPDTIAKLRQAGIIVWVLTGDKQETAINIAYSCKLFSQSMEIVKLNARSRDAAETTIKFHLQSIEKDDDGSGSTSSESRALVIDGKTLVYILDKRAELQDSFLRLTKHCSSVLCCRATPLQKAYIVRIVKEELKMHTLAIGDGANDVSMIQTADVGIGISGQEGMQSVMASDFAISRFKYLERLLLVHGHWNYDRLARMVLYFFYKNAAFVFVCFWYQLYCGFSGTVMIDQMYLMLYNLIFTSLPPMAIGVLDQDAKDVILLEKPVLYSQGRLGQVYQSRSFWVNIADALYQSLVIFFVTAGAYQSSDVGIWEYGTVICTECLLVMSLHLAIEAKSWTIIHWSSIALSVFLYFLFGLFYNAVCSHCTGLQNPYWVMQHMLGTLRFWLVCVLTLFASVLPRLAIRAFQNTARPSLVTQAVSQASGHDQRGCSDCFKRRECSYPAKVVRADAVGRDQNTEMTAIV